jgi:hypothetical protein
MYAADLMIDFNAVNSTTTHFFFRRLLPETYRKNSQSDDFNTLMAERGRSALDRFNGLARLADLSTRSRSKC